MFIADRHRTDHVARMLFTVRHVFNVAHRQAGHEYGNEAVAVDQMGKSIGKGNHSQRQKFFHAKRHLVPASQVQHQFADCPPK